ncbi:GDSL-like lipase/acylhydrolase [Salinisphaera sp. PC39]|uniref:arylesterase n=1 Tax=Salinisphaera sp. PC39 TaxID=1304156 RepID=UPI003340FF5A
MRALLSFVLASVLSCVALPAAAGGVLVLGDSIGAGYGLPPEAGWVHALGERLDTVCPGMPVHNASVSGETSAGGRRRLPELLDRHEPGVVVIELGGNDGLRGLPVAELRANLAAIVETARAAGARVLLLGMRIPPNYGPAYTESFAAAFDTVAEAASVAYVPFLLEGIALDESLMQADGIHPNAAAQPAIAAKVWPALKPLVGSQCDNGDEEG